ncbi:hypothetical protein NECAME_17632 [Necator americanus]|uniref:Uncharacterized protein n=1 Tax=Necator americanus TaxID=51031 RepID=W2TMD4_NECAM|nr:hypothetical protein NECAME_17632 [Necator americanus]ETN82804.1 hypothetical protein NECAME_17632 [Necator americanus]
MNGFPNPRDCTKCVCPSGFGVIFVTKEHQTILVLKSRLKASHEDLLLMGASMLEWKLKLIKIFASLVTAPDDLTENTTKQPKTTGSTTKKPKANSDCKDDERYFLSPNAEAERLLQRRALLTTLKRKNMQKIMSFMLNAYNHCK